MFERHSMKKSKIEIRDIAKTELQPKHLRVSSELRAGMQAMGTTCSPCADDCGLGKSLE
jgi:hypothetical protein